MKQLKKEQKQNELKRLSKKKGVARGDYYKLKYLLIEAIIDKAKELTEMGYGNVEFIPNYKEWDV